MSSPTPLSFTHKSNRRTHLLRQQIKASFLCFACVLAVHFFNPSNGVCQTIRSESSAQNSPAETTVNSHENSDQTVSAGSDVTPTHKPLIRFLPNGKIDESDPDESLKQSITSPATRLTESESEPGFLEQIGRVKVRRDHSGDTLVEYQFKKKSEAALQADARQNKSDPTGEAPKQLSIFVQQVEVRE